MHHFAFTLHSPSHSDTTDNRTLEFPVSPPSMHNHSTAVPHSETDFHFTTCDLFPVCLKEKMAVSKKWLSTIFFKNSKNLDSAMDTG